MVKLLKKKQCFISHCSDDISIILQLQETINKVYPESYKFFNTSSLGHGTLAGNSREQQIRKALSESDVMIAVLTDSYIRSPICISELSSFWYMNKTVIPIIFSEDARVLLMDIFGQDIIYIDAGIIARKKQENDSDYLKYVGKATHDLIVSLNKSGYKSKNEDVATKEFDSFFGCISQPIPKRSYIGARDIYKKILKYCEAYKVYQISNSSLPMDELKAKLGQYKNIYILSTTGSTLIHALTHGFLIQYIANGGNVTVLVPNKYSDFVEDVARIENPHDNQSESARLAQEFVNVTTNLIKCMKHPTVLKSDNPGHIYFGCSQTLLRQTITLSTDESDAWGWLSMTIPPKRTVDGTPSFEFGGNVNEPSMAKLAYDHIQSMIRIAKMRNEWIEITKDTNKIPQFILEKRNGYLLWKNMYDQAKLSMLRRTGSLELIEVAAQHPLNEDGTPGIEFKNRLDLGIELYHQIKERGGIPKLYVPGSLHLYNGIPDVISLSESGTKYLLEHGIDTKDIFGPESNVRYKGEDGVYNSADECYVASQIFLNGNYHRLHCVCSSNQMLRKKLFYIAFGIIAQYHTVDADMMFHDDIEELFLTIPQVLYREDHTWQDPNEERFLNSRLERKPGFKK